MKRSGTSRRIVLAAFALPPVVLSLSLLLLLHAGQSAQLVLSVALFVLSPLAAFVELAALIVGFRDMRSGELQGVVGFAGIAIGAVTLVGAVFLLGLLLGGGGV